MFIGDDVTITMTGDWVTNRVPRSYDRAGRLVIKDGATLCLPQVKYGDTSFESHLVSVDFVNGSMSDSDFAPTTEYVFEEGSKVFVHGSVAQTRDRSVSYVWRVNVKRNAMAVV